MLATNGAVSRSTDHPQPPPPHQIQNHVQEHLTVSMQVRICTPVASGIRFSFQELWTVWILMFYKTPMAAAALCVICIACPTTMHNRAARIPRINMLESDYKPRYVHGVWIHPSPSVEAMWPGCVKGYRCKVARLQLSSARKPQA